MIFAIIPTTDAEHTILAHGVRAGDIAFKKGRILSASDIATLKAANIKHVTTARLEADDVPEDEAARAVAVALAGSGTMVQQAFTGRANLHASGHGLVAVDEPRLRAINHVHESLTIATLHSHRVVSPKQLLATVKIIPFATPRSVLDKVLQIIGDTPLVKVRPFQRKAIHLIITKLPNTKVSIIAKSEQSIAARLAALGLSLLQVAIVPHIQADVQSAITDAAQSGSDCILVFGASAIVDRGDVIPAGLRDAGGDVIHLGMPVDPGNLLMLGHIKQTPVIGIPSCARSPKTNGFDFVLERILAGIWITAEDIMDMGAGGLLAEIPSRPSPRERTVQSAPHVTAIVLAGGKSSRMGSNKMLADFHGQPMLRATVERLQASAVDEVIVITGHQRAGIEAALKGLSVRVVHNPDYAEGLSTSLRVGVNAAKMADAVLVCLGDMPLVQPATIDKLIAAFNPTEHRSIVVPTVAGHGGNQWGNPVLWGQEHFQRLTSLTGDKGARHLIGEMKAEATEVITTDEGILQDVDTPEVLERLRALRP
jgi:molybdenum cofactor cytidylyltransferase